MHRRSYPKEDQRTKVREAAIEAKIAHGTEPLPGVSPAVEREVARLSGTLRRYIKADIVEQRAAVERLMIEGAKARQIWRILRATKDESGQLRWPNITLRTVELRITQVRHEREAEAVQNTKAERTEMREMMIERLQDMRQKAMLQKPPNFKAAVACEREIAKLKGLYAPTKVEVDGKVDHSHAMMAVIANMDPEVATELLEEAKTERRLANEARRLLPSLVVETASSEE